MFLQSNVIEFFSEKISVLLGSVDKLIATLLSHVTDEATFSTNSMLKGLIDGRSWSSVTIITAR